MKFVGGLCFAFGCAAAVSASAAPPYTGNGKLVSGSLQLPANHWVADPVAKEALPAAKALETRGGGNFDIKTNKALWAALCLHGVGALCAGIKPDLISSHLMTVDGGATEWCTNLLAITWFSMASHTFLSIQDGSSNVIKISEKVNISTLGTACLWGIWKYSQGTFDHKHTVGFVAVTGVLTAALMKKNCDK